MFETLWKAASEEEQKPEKPQASKRSRRRPRARQLMERVVHDLADVEKHCDGCGKDLRLIAEETSERCEFIPAVMKVIEDVRLKYACDCTGPDGGETRAAD